MNDAEMRALLAREAIRRLLSLYADAVARRDADAVAPLFAPDAVVVIAGGPERVGRAAAVEGLRKTISGFSFLHQKCDTGLIDITGGEARARIGVMEINRPMETDSFNLVFGAYDDVYRRKGDRWYFQDRRFSLNVLARIEPKDIQQFDLAPPLTAFVP